MLRSLAFLLKQTWKYQKSYIFYAVALQLVTVAMPMASIIFPKYIVDELLGQRRAEWLIIYVAALAGINFFGGILRDFFQGKMFIAKGVVFNKFECEISERLLDCDFENIENPKFLDIKEKAHKFLYANGHGFGAVLTSAFDIIGKLFVFAGVAVIMSTLSVWIVLIFTVLVLLSAVVDSDVRKSYTKWDMEKTPIERKTFYLDNVIRDFSYGKDIRIYNAKNFLLDKISNNLNESNAFYAKQVKVLNRSKYFNTLMTLFRDGSAYAYLIYMVLRASIGIGDFTMYIGAASQFADAMNSLMQSILDIRQFSGYYDALEQYLNVPCKMREGKKMTSLDGKGYEIEFHNVSFKYSGQAAYALKNVSIKIKSGEKLAIIGENGAGKTTFVKLLMRLYDPLEGRITINGVDIRDIDYDYYQSLMSAVFQDYKLFSFSIKDNISFGKEADDNRIEDILRRLGLGKKLDNLPMGINSYIYKNFEADGFEPSGGEGQKIAIARAVYKNAPIIILDEPTAALDPRAEYEIYQSFDRLAKGKSAIYISHRMSSAKFCDKIAVFKSGEICEYGSHSELIETNGLYAELFKMQAGLYV